MVAIALSWMSRMMCGVSGASIIVGLVVAATPIPVYAQENVIDCPGSAAPCTKRCPVGSPTCGDDGSGMGFCNCS
jgi:hypothetical protein